MIAFLVTTVFIFILYLILTAGSGTIGLWSYEELGAGIVLSLLIGAVSSRFFCKERSVRMVNPVRILILLIYVLILFPLEMARANLDVAYRVITGRIRPGIIRIHPGLQTDLGILMLANSITLTPGTLTVAADEKTGDLFIHLINIPEGVLGAEVMKTSDLFSFFDLPAWIRRIAE